MLLKMKKLKNLTCSGGFKQRAAKTLSPRARKKLEQVFAQHYYNVIKILEKFLFLYQKILFVDFGTPHRRLLFRKT